MNINIIRPWEDEACALWLSCELTAAEIGTRFGVSANTIIGLAHRRGWAKPQPTTTLERLDALHANMDAVLAETAPIIADRRTTASRPSASATTNAFFAQRQLTRSVAGRYHVPALRAQLRRTWS